ncbi:hypothetical protein H2203_002138 [Taxawa tesnikishii (nom. ined.)]|nr:hypothetical protein H2203_002138 [Dothideales sp. JES 119]
MGGLVSAEVVLVSLQAEVGLRHRILGTINFDVPFLGMHPGVIKSGLASIFNPAPDTPTQPEAQTLSPITSLGLASPEASEGPFSPPARADTFFNPDQPDPNFNPAFQNDVVLPVRKGWRNVWHFVNKHSDNLTAATKQLISSHMEFGGAMADYSGLKMRYARIRALEEQNEDIRRSVVSGNSAPPRVRFVNYYTASTGRPKKPKSPQESPSSGLSVGKGSLVMNDTTAQNDAQEEPAPRLSTSTSQSRSPRLSLEEHTNEGLIVKYIGQPDEASSSPEPSPRGSMEHLDPRPVSSRGSVSSQEAWTDAMEELQLATTTEDQALSPTLSGALSPSNTSILSPSSASTPLPSQSQASLALTPATSSSSSSLLPIPDLPPPPQKPDFSTFADKDTRKLAEKEYLRLSRSHEKAVKDRQKALKERAKLEEKLLKKRMKDDEKAAKEREKERKKKGEEREDEYERRLGLERRETEREWKEFQAGGEHEDGEEKEEIPRDENGVPRPDWKSDYSKGRERSSETGLGGQGYPPDPPKENLSTLRAVEEKYGEAVAQLNLSNDKAVPKGKQKKTEEPEKSTGPPKDRMFCTLPPKDSVGNRDPCWVRIFMKDVDEVGAHCGLFFTTDGDRYERLVGDVAERIEEWVGEAESERIARSLGGVDWVTMG